mmetsp:Transcript_3616/g.15305  ORF Transcript_3616/g.15305 Transcript_3616/m.15305 type:complete len:238 (-) Transcript_3616:1172-1885(-)
MHMKVLKVRSGARRAREKKTTLLRLGDERALQLREHRRHVPDAHVLRGEVHEPSPGRDPVDAFGPVVAHPRGHPQTLRGDGAAVRRERVPQVADPQVPGITRREEVPAAFLADVGVRLVLRAFALHRAKQRGEQMLFSLPYLVLVQTGRLRGAFDARRRARAPRRRRVADADARRRPHAARRRPHHPQAGHEQPPDASRDVPRDAQSPRDPGGQNSGRAPEQRRRGQRRVRRRARVF